MQSSGMMRRCILSHVTGKRALFSSLSTHGEKSSALYFTGGGNYYYWFAGASIYLKENCDLAGVPMLGASAGSLAATMLKIGVDFQVSTEESIEMADHVNLYDRKGGLAGVWGPLIREWLGSQIPDTLHPQSTSGLYVTITPVKSTKPKLISNFESKQDVIDACMTSIHIPLFLDGRAVTTYKGELAVDGSFWHFVTRKVDRLPLPSELECRKEDVFWVDWRQDSTFRERMRQKSRITPAFRVLERQLIYEMMDAGYSFMKNKHEQGKLPLTSSKLLTALR
jgi:hypothetical protein